MVLKYDFLNIIGLMTGTSMDGIDISLVQTNGLVLKRLNKNYFYKYSVSTKEKLINILKEKNRFNIARKRYLDDFITNEHYLALRDLDVLKTCDLIGFHGQTVYHNPEEKTSIQLGNPKKLSKMLNKNVVFDFRTNDLKLGGQGAPLAPIYHKFIIEELNLDLPTCIVNIGGVANLTYWDGLNLLGFDTGPGNALMDDYTMSKFQKNYDKNGFFASKGLPIKKEVQRFIQNDIFKKIAPKSFDRNSFQTAYKELIQKNYSVYNIMATLLEFTTESIAISIEKLPKKVKNIIISGGGYKNLHLISSLEKRLKSSFLKETDLKLEFDYIESELIAFLAARSIYKLPYTFPSTTGILKPSSGGNLYRCL